MSNKIVFEIGIGFHTSTVIKTEVKINDINFVFEYYPSFGMLTIDRYIKQEKTKECETNE